MNKQAINISQKQEITPSPQRRLRLAAVMHQHLYEFVIEQGMKALDTLLEQDLEVLCGPKHRRGAEHEAQRWGRTEGRLVIGGRRILNKRPRARKDGHEVVLPSWSQFSNEDPLERRTMEQMMVGVSTRNYERTLEELPDDLDPHGASKSATSRRFVELTQEKLEEWLNRDLSQLRLVVVMIDGLVVAEQTVVAALGIDENGQKHPLGLWQGATENTEVCEGLLSDLVSRGVDPQQAYLFVIDGGKALRRSIRTVFGKRSLVQRCQVHKLRNVLGHLPKSLHASVSKVMHDAYRSSSKHTARTRLLNLIAQLETEHPDAAQSLREGLEETLTVKDWNLPAILERALSTTNVIENLNGTIRRVSRNVKRWRDGSMIRRWAAAGILEAQRSFRRLRGHVGMPALIAALRSAEQTTTIDHQEHAA